MSFMDELRATSQTGPGLCKVAKWIESIDDGYRSEILEALASEYASNAIWRAIVNREGQLFSDTLLNRHRKGECGCGIQG